MGQILKSINFTRPKNKSILLLKKELELTMIEARDLYEKMCNGHFIGSNSRDIYQIYGLYLFCDWINIEWEDAPLSNEEIELKKRVDEANAWVESLSEQDRAHHELLISMVPIAVGYA